MRFKRTISQLVLTGILCVGVAPIHAERLSGSVVGIADGDTLTLLSPEKVQTRIRLAQIDAPEKKQAFGQKSKASLSDLVYGQAVEVEVETLDRYGRSVGTVFRQGQDINLEQIRRGMAWVYRRYAKDPLYLESENKARSEKQGLWSDPDAVPPWEFRQNERKRTRQDRH